VPILQVFSAKFTHILCKQDHFITPSMFFLYSKKVCLTKRVSKFSTFLYKIDSNSNAHKTLYIISFKFLIEQIFPIKSRGFSLKDRGRKIMLKVQSNPAKMCQGKCSKMFFSTIFKGPSGLKPFAL
jgi:hypothetical protein